MEFRELEREVIKWGRKVGLYDKPSVPAQLKKLDEEYAELVASWVVSNQLEMFDAIGDMLVVLTHIANYLGTDLTTCYQGAYNEIKDRKGKMINGIFVKEADLDGKTTN